MAPCNWHNLGESDAYCTKTLWTASFADLISSAYLDSKVVCTSAASLLAALCPRTTFLVKAVSAAEDFFKFGLAGTGSAFGRALGAK